MSKVLQVLKMFGLPFAYDHFAEGESPLPPFAVYRYTGANNFNADGVVYYPIAETDIELYTDKKDLVLERRLEKILTDAEICYTKSEVWIESERLYEVVYSFDEVIQTDSYVFNKRLDDLEEKVDNIEIASDPAIETSLVVNITARHITQKSLELPEDCDMNRAIMLALQGVVMAQGVDWDVREFSAPDKDLIVWNGLGLENLVRLGDNIVVTYYKKV